VNLMSIVSVGNLTPTRQVGIGRLEISRLADVTDVRLGVIS